MAFKRIQTCGACGEQMDWDAGRPPKATNGIDPGRKDRLVCYRCGKVYAEDGRTVVHTFKPRSVNLEPTVP